jgi:hypothetical protein
MLVARTWYGWVATLNRVFTKHTNDAQSKVGVEQRHLTTLY